MYNKYNFLIIRKIGKKNVNVKIKILCLIFKVSFQKHCPQHTLLMYKHKYVFIYIVDYVHTYTLFKLFLLSIFWVFRIKRKFTCMIKNMCPQLRRLYETLSAMFTNKRANACVQSSVTIQSFLSREFRETLHKKMI